MSNLGRGFVPLKDKLEIRRQTVRFRRWRPWMWGPLSRVWMFGWDQVTLDYLYGPAEYVWCGWDRKNWRKVKEETDD